MGPAIEDDVMPLFLINGFLEAGKTEFLQFTMEQEYFQTEGKALLIVCEETAVQRNIGFSRIVQFNTVGISTICISSGRKITAADFVDNNLWFFPIVTAAGDGQHQECKKQDYLL